MRIIQAAIEHCDVLADLFDQYRQFYSQKSDVAGATQFLRQRISSDESVAYLALSTDDTDMDRPMGFVHLYPSFSSISMRRAWILNDLYVIPEARSRGVGRALMAAGHTLAEETDACYVVLETAADNHGAQRLYESMGYVRDTEYHHYVWNAPTST